VVAGNTRTSSPTV